MHIGEFEWAALLGEENFFPTDQRKKNLSSPFQRFFSTCTSICFRTSCDLWEFNLPTWMFHRSLQWLRGTNKNVELELDTIRSNIRTSRFNMDNMNSNLSSISHNGLPMKYSFKSIVTNVKSVLKNARLVKPVLITCGLMIFQRFTGEWETTDS